MQTDATLLANNTQQCWELLALVASVCMGLKLDQARENAHASGIKTRSKTELILWSFSLTCVYPKLIFVLVLILPTETSLMYTSETESIA